MTKWTQIFFGRNLFAPRRKKIEVTVETEQTLQIRRLTRHNQNFCAECREVALFLSLEDAAQTTQIDLPSLENLAAGGAVHFTETAENEIFICFNSLKTEIGKIKKIKGSN